MKNYKTAYLIIRFNRFNEHMKLKEVYNYAQVVLKPDVGGKGIMIHSHDYSKRDIEVLRSLFDGKLYGSAIYYEVKCLIPERFYNRERLLSHEHIFSKKYSCVLDDQRTEFHMAWLT